MSYCSYIHLGPNSPARSESGIVIQFCWLGEPISHKDLIALEEQRVPPLRCQGFPWSLICELRSLLTLEFVCPVYLWWSAEAWAHQPLMSLKCRANLMQPMPHLRTGKIQTYSESQGPKRVHWYLVAHAVWPWIFHRDMDRLSLSHQSSAGSRIDTKVHRIWSSHVRSVNVRNFQVFAFALW